MTCLFLDTSSSYLTVSLVIDNEVRDLCYKYLGKDMSRYAITTIDEMLKKNDVKPIDINKIICVNGPGSYTGLRIGVTIAKTYAWSLDIKVYAISSLFAMATSIDDTKYIIPVIDARRNSYFAGIYNDKYENILEDKYITKEELNKEINKLDGKYIFVSTEQIIDEDNFKIYQPNIKNILKFMPNNLVDAHMLIPNYLKKTEAEENLGI